MAETPQAPAEGGTRPPHREGGSRPPHREGGSRPPHREGGRPQGGDRRRRFQVRRKVCRFCVDKTPYVDYKDIKTLKFFITERGKILPRRISGNCAGHQREITVAIKRCRSIALIPYAGEK